MMVPHGNDLFAKFAAYKKPMKGVLKTAHSIWFFVKLPLNRSNRPMICAVCKN
jgi:hypothetical protein